MGIFDFFKGDEVEDNRDNVRRYLSEFGLKENQDYWQDEGGGLYCKGEQSSVCVCYIILGW